MQKQNRVPQKQEYVQRSHSTGAYCVAIRWMKIFILLLFCLLCCVHINAVNLVLVVAITIDAQELYRGGFS